MQGMCLAESAVFLYFHPVRMRLLILGSIVITIFALSTRKSYPCTHDSFLRNPKIFAVTKKRALPSIAIRIYHTPNLQSRKKVNSFYGSLHFPYELTHLTWRLFLIFSYQLYYGGPDDGPV